MNFTETKEYFLDELSIYDQMYAFNDLYADPYGDYTPEHVYPWSDTEERCNSIRQIARLYKMDEVDVFEMGINASENFLTERYKNFVRIYQRSWGYALETVGGIEELGDEFDSFIQYLVDNNIDLKEWHASHQS